MCCHKYVLGYQTDLDRLIYEHVVGEVSYNER